MQTQLASFNGGNMRLLGSTLLLAHAMVACFPGPIPESTASDASTDSASAVASDVAFEATTPETDARLTDATEEVDTSTTDVPDDIPDVADDTVVVACSEAIECASLVIPCHDVACIQNACVRVARSEGSCDDGNLCTSNDTCSAGTCRGSTRTCGAADDCEGPGVCDPSTGSCVFARIEDGRSCDDGSPCTLDDACGSSGCEGRPKMCPAEDACREPSSCDPGTGDCVEGVPRSGGWPCDDGDACTIDDACDNGRCEGTPKVCEPVDDCHEPGVCEQQTGVCTNPARDDGTDCDDGQPCTTLDRCMAGTCSGTPILCTSIGQCFNAGTCIASTGTCSTPAKTLGTACDDSDGCTTDDYCDAGACISGPNVDDSIADWMLQSFDTAPFAQVQIARATEGPNGQTIALVSAKSDLEIQGESFAELPADASAIVAMAEIDVSGRVVGAVRVMTLRSPAQFEPVTAHAIQHVGGGRYLVSLMTRAPAEIVMTSGETVTLDAVRDGATLPFKHVVMLVDATGRALWYAHSHGLAAIETGFTEDGDVLWTHYVSDGGHVVDGSGTVHVPAFDGVPVPEGHSVFMRFDADGVVRDFAGVSTNATIRVVGMRDVDAFCAQHESADTPLFVTTSNTVRELGESDTSCVAFVDTGAILWTVGLRGSVPRAVAASRDRFAINLRPVLSSVEIHHTAGVTEAFVGASSRDRSGLVAFDERGELAGTQELPNGSTELAYSGGDVLAFGVCAGQVVLSESAGSMDCSTGAFYVARLTGSLAPIWNVRVAHPVADEAPMPTGTPLQVVARQDGAIVPVLTTFGHEGWFGSQTGVFYFDATGDSSYIIGAVNSRGAIDCSALP